MNWSAAYAASLSLRFHLIIGISYKGLSAGIVLGLLTYASTSPSRDSDMLRYPVPT